MKENAAKLAALVLVLIAIAAGGYWVAQQRKGEAPAGGDGEFKLADVGDRAFDGAPALALTFTQPLDTRTRYDAYVQVFEMPPRPGEKQTPDDQGADPDDDENRIGVRSDVSTNPRDLNTEGGKLVAGSWVVGRNPRLLYFPQVKPETRYVVKIASALKGRAHRPLGKDAQYSVRTASVAPAYYFPSRGMVLPAKQNGGLPVTTVNVPEVDVQFLRVKPASLSTFLDRVIAAGPSQDEPSTGRSDPADEPDYRGGNDRALRGAVSMYELDQLHTMTDSVYVGRFVTEQKPNRRSVTFLPVEDIKELKEPGVYIAVMSRPGRFRHDFQTTYFYVSDLGLHVRLFPKAAETFVSSLVDGKGVTGVEVSWLDEKGKPLARAQSDGNGRASFAERPKGARVVLARKNDQLSLIALREPALDLSEYDVVGAPFKPTRLFAYSGRNLYRPGESFDLSVVARDADGRPVPAQPVQAILKRPDGKQHFAATWQPDQRAAGYYLKRIDIPADAPTGFWTLELRIDPADKVPGTVYRFGVEEFLPERMKLDLSSASPVLTRDADFTVDVQGTYLYGAPAAGNRLLGVAQFERNKNPLAKQFPGFEFGDVADDTLKTRQELAETELDTEGKAQVSVDLAPAAKRRSPVTVRATMSLLETGGRPVVRTIERVIWPAPVLIGIRGLFNGDYAQENSVAEFEVVRADASGAMKPAAALPVRVYNEDRQYYWRFDDQRGWHSGFTEQDELVDTAAVTVTANGRGKLALRVGYGRYRIEITDPETKQTLRYRFYAGWGARLDETQGSRPDRVALKFDKPAYRDGETAKLTISPPHGGEAIVTVEGDRVLWARRLSVPAKGATIDIPVERDWKRHDLYVSVLVLRPGNEGSKVTPARALGILHLPLERGDRKLKVELDAPKKMLPETNLRVRVRVPDAKGERALVTLSAVDVGILNITRFATPDPHAFFFGKLRYGADQHDVYGRLIEKMEGRKGRLKFGGDNTPKATRSLPKKVRLVDLFSGPVLLNERGEAEINLPVPDFNGTLRLMAVVSANERFGSADAETIVAAPLVAEINTPRFVNFGDTATIALDLHNLSGSPQKIAVTLDSDAGLKIGEGRRTVALKDQEKAVLRFSLQAGEALGLSNITLKAEGQGITINRTFPLMVQAPTPPQNIMKRYTVQPGASVSIREPELGGLHRASVGAHVVVSTTPPIDVRAAVQGLLVYPYGCAEQTTSSAYPHVFVDAEAAKRFGLKPYTREQRAEMLGNAMSRLAAMHAPSGGFSLWGNASDYEYWLTSYIASFLLDAKDQGFAVPEQMQKRTSDFLLRNLQEGVSRLPQSAQAPAPVAPNERYSQQALQQREAAARFGALAYGAYVLARESKASVASLRQLYDARAVAHSGLPLVQLGIALRLMGDEQRGNAAIAEGVAKPRLDADYWWSDYGSTLRDASLSYALLERHKVPAEGRDYLITAIAGELERKQYFSTQERLAVFLVGQAFTAGKAGPWSASVTSGKSVEKIEAARTHYRELTAAELANGISIANTHNEALYVELAYSGVPIKAPAPKSDLIALTRALYKPDGTFAGELKVGETLIAHLTVQSKVQIANGLVVDRIPAGLEIENLNIVQGEGTSQITVPKVDVAAAMGDARVKHREFRDDRYVAAVKLEAGTTVHLLYRLRVVTPGKFIVPALYAEDMYRPNVYGTAGGADTMVIVDAKSR